MLCLPLVHCYSYQHSHNNSEWRWLGLPQRHSPLHREVSLGSSSSWEALEGDVSPPHCLFANTRQLCRTWVCLGVSEQVPVPFQCKSHLNKSCIQLVGHILHICFITSCLQELGAGKGEKQDDGGAPR